MLAETFKFKKVQDVVIIMYIFIQFRPSFYLSWIVKYKSSKIIVLSGIVQKDSNKRKQSGDHFLIRNFRRGRIQIFDFLTVNVYINVERKWCLGVSICCKIIHFLAFILEKCFSTTYITVEPLKMDTPWYRPKCLS